MLKAMLMVLCGGLVTLLMACTTETTSVQLSAQGQESRELNRINESPLTAIKTGRADVKPNVLANKDGLTLFRDHVDAAVKN